LTSSRRSERYDFVRHVRHIGWPSRPGSPTATAAATREFQVGEGGLGYQIVQYSGIADSATAWAAITLLGTMSVALYTALVLVERLALPWVRETTSER
jgi:NitT/TauT family transport system permease protein